VKILMTEAAKAFITPLTLETLSKNAVLSDISSESEWNNHVELGQWAEAMLIAPCTANTLGKLANGLVDNLVLATYLSAKCPVFIAPAMDLDMWKHGSTKKNLDVVKSYGDEIIPVEHGELASGLVGEGRMAEPENILTYLEAYFSKKKDLTDQKIMVTAGPTYEKIDPVRYIGNPSSGKMGIAVAEECASRGAKVTLIQGPGHLKANHANITTIKITSAQQMYEASLEAYKTSHVAVFAAAVADYTPQTYSDQKIKKKEGDMSIGLKRTKDIAGSLGEIKKEGQINIGFALETQNMLNNAKSKLERKNFDFIVLNTVNDAGAGFQTDTNKVKLVLKNGKILEYPLKSKTKVAEDIVNQLVQLQNNDSEN